MIPQEQLESLKPLSDQVKRMAQIKSKRTLPVKRHYLTKRQRQWAAYIQRIGVIPKYPSGERLPKYRSLKERGGKKKK